MAKEKVTLTLSAENLAALRSLAGHRSLSAEIDEALAAHVDRLRHLAAVDVWLAEHEQEHGPVPPETLEWAAQLVDEWEAGQRGEKVARPAAKATRRPRSGPSHKAG